MNRSGIISLAAALLLLTLRPALAGPLMYLGDGYTWSDARGTIYTAAADGALTPFVNLGYSIRGLATDKSGNLYADVSGNPDIYKITPGGTVSTFATGFADPYGEAFDASGNLYVADTFSGVSKITPGGIVSPFATLPHALGLAFDGSGNLLVSSGVNGSISKITPGGEMSNFVTLPVRSLTGLAFDVSGNLYAADEWDHWAIDKITPDGNVSTYANTGLVQPQWLVFDPSGNLYTCSWPGNTEKIAPGGAVVSSFAGVGGPMVLVPPVPEPATLSLLALCGLAVIRRRR